MQGDDPMRDDQKAMNGLRLALHTPSDNAGPCNAPPHNDSHGPLAERVIAALRRGGRGCCVMLSEDETLH
jgi:hypothetical protein